MNNEKVMSWLDKCEKGVFNRVRAIAIFKDGSYIGKMQVAYPKDGAGTLRVFLWDFGNNIQMGTAGGYGYDKLSAALRGLKFQGIEFQDHPENWEIQLREAGYQAVTVI